MYTSAMHEHNQWLRETAEGMSNEQIAAALYGDEATTALQGIRQGVERIWRPFDHETQVRRSLINRYEESGGRIING
jgi:hypothetical protein